MNVKHNRERLLLHCALESRVLQILFAETIGTFIWVAFGTGAIAQAVLIRPSRNSAADMATISLGWGIGLCVAICVSRRLSGAHLNPAVTLAQACRFQTAWTNVPVYFFAQYLGAYLAAACVYGVYENLIDVYDGGIRSMSGVNGTGKFFATVPTQGVSLGSLFADNFFNTALLILGILAITDERSKMSHSLQPLLIGLLVAGLIMTFGLNSGAALNPARDLGPRLLLVTVGYTDAFSVPVQSPTGALSYFSYFWITLVACHLGGIIGGLVFDLTFHGPHNHDDENETKTESINTSTKKYGSFSQQNTTERCSKQPVTTYDTHAELFMVR